MADPTNRLCIDFVRLTYHLEPEIILADDLEITWLSHKLLGGEHIKTSVFELLNRDPDSSALITFTDPQVTDILLSCWRHGA